MSKMLLIIVVWYDIVTNVTFCGHNGANTVSQHKRCSLANDNWVHMDHGPHHSMTLYNSVMNLQIISEVNLILQGLWKFCNFHIFMFIFITHLVVTSCFKFSINVLKTYHALIESLNNLYKEMLLLKECWWMHWW